jgi:hypothetical protein
MLDQSQTLTSIVGLTTQGLWYFHGHCASESVAMWIEVDIPISVDILEDPGKELSYP